MAVWNKNNLGFYLPVVLNNKRRFYVDATSGNDGNTGKQARRSPGRRLQQ